MTVMRIGLMEKSFGNEIRESIYEKDYYSGR